MASTIILSDNGASSGSAGLKSTAGNDGVLILQTTTSGGTATNAVYINTSQNVGIGTSSPEKKLTVAGGVSGTTFDAALFVNAEATNTANTAAAVYLSGSGGIARSSFIQGVNTGGATNAHAITFGTSGDYATPVERARIDSSGNLLVGSSSGANARLFVVGATSDSTQTVIRSQNSSASDVFFVRNDGSMAVGTSAKMDFTSSGGLTLNSTSDNILSLNKSSGTNWKYINFNQAGTRDMYIGTDNNRTGSWYMDSASNRRVEIIAYTGGVYLSSGATSWAGLSDARLKNVTGQIDNALDIVGAIETARFTWKDDEDAKPQIGVIAQSVQAVLPEVIDVSKKSSRPDDVEQDETEYLAVRYTEIIPVLVKAIQEQQALITTLTERITALEAK